jgi:hypothetical protein
LDATTDRFLKYGAAFASAMISAGYMELREPEVVAMMEYTDCEGLISTNVKVSCSLTVIMKSPAVPCDAP